MQEDVRKRESEGDRRENEESREGRNGMGSKKRDAQGKGRGKKRVIERRAWKEEEERGYGPKAVNGPRTSKSEKGLARRKSRLRATSERAKGRRGGGYSVTETLLLERLDPKTT